MAEAKSHTPKFKQLESRLRHLISSLPVGAKLPAERELAHSFDCNFLTIRKALGPLTEEGIIVRRVGSGTFVQRHPTPGSQDGPAGEKIGVLVYRDSNAYDYSVLQAAAQAALSQGLELRSAWVRDFADAALTQAGQLKTSGCRALILPWFPHDRVDEVRKFVRNSPLPVSLPLVIPGLEKNCFEQSEIFGAHAITTIESLCHYFQRLGQEQIAFLGPDTPGDPILQKKLSAYACHTSRENLPNLCGLVASDISSVDQLAAAWSSSRGRIAVISYDDEHALRFMTAMHKRGWSAPDDYQIIGFNDIEASRYSDPPLSTIVQNYDYIGEWLLKNAVALADDRVNQSDQVPRIRLLVRATCGGQSRINEEFKSSVPSLDIVLPGEGPLRSQPGHGDSAPPAPEIAADSPDSPSLRSR